MNKEELVKNHETFNTYVYTPVNEALEELRKRRANPEIQAKIAKTLNSIPEPLREGPRAVLFRQVATPNHEIIRFLTITELVGLPVLFWEYLEDKFVPKNEVKYYLGNLAFYKGTGKKGGLKWEFEKIIDFNSSNGKKISQVKTLWGESLTSFHHSLFQNRDVGSDAFFDASNWLTQNGGSAIEYYKKYLSLFICHGVLFENLMLDEQELEFTKNVFLPAFEEVHKEFGLKPIIVALEPTEIETDTFWMSHPYPHKKLLRDRIAQHKKMTPIKKLLYNIEYGFKHLF